MEKILAVAIFVVMFALIIWDRFPRQWVTLGSGALVLVLVFGLCMHDGGAIWETLNLSCFIQKGFWLGSSESNTGINWSTIVFIAGMMVMVEGMGHAGIFQWLCLKIAKLVHYRTVPLLICFMVMSALLAMFIDSITVILFLAAVTAELAKTLYFDPVPMILAEIFCANLGGSATMCGDPPNIIIGTSLGLSFFDFLGNTGVIAAVCLVFTVVYFFLCFRKPLAQSEKNRPADVVYPDAASAVTNRAGFYGCGASFLVVVVLLITHAQTELTVATIGCIAAALMSLVTLLTSGRKAAAGLFARVDYKTLLFFTGLFVVVAGLERTGCLAVLADGHCRHQRRQGRGDGGHHPVGVRRGQRLCGQHSLCRHHGAGDPGHGSDPGCGPARAGLGAVHGNGSGRQRHAHRRLRQCGGHVRGRQERPSRHLGQVLPLLRAGHHHGDGGVHGVHCGAVHVNQKDLRLGRGSFIAIKENHCSHSGGTHHGHIRNSGRGCIFSDTIHMGAVNGSSERYTFRMPNTFPISELPSQQSSESSLHGASSPRRRRSKYMRSSRDSMEKNNM